jgi:hypothetical protein
LPADASANILKPGLMRDHSRLSQDQSRNQAAKADIVLEEEIAPAEQSKNFGDRWSPG